MKFRKKPVVVEALRFDGSNEDEVRAFTGNMCFRGRGQIPAYDDPDITAEVWDKLHSTWVGVKNGQWIIRGVQGEFYPCDPDVFGVTYEPVDE